MTKSRPLYVAGVRPTRYQQIALVAGASVTLAVAAYLLACGGPGPGDALLSGAILASPCVVLASNPRPRSRFLFTAAAVLIAAGTVAGLAASATDSTGALIFIVLLPLEVVIAAVGAWVGRVAVPA